MALYEEYAVDDEIAAFFRKTTATQTECEARARQLTGSERVLPITIQGVCSYSVYSGDHLEYVVQCRLRSLAIKSEVSDLAKEVYGSLVPTVSFKGVLGDDIASDRRGDREPLYVYLMTRMAGTTQLDFILSHEYAQDSPEYFQFRQNFIGDITHFFALSWLAPQTVCQEYRNDLKKSYIRDLNLLHASLPDRFRLVVQTCLASIDDIMSLPMVLSHKDFGACNLLVEETSCPLKGVVDWAEAVVCPFGLNLHSLHAFTGTMHLRNGWSRFPDYEQLQETFWRRFLADVGGLSSDEVHVIKKAMQLGMLLSHGFTSRLANESEPVPVKDDEHGRYHLMYLDGFVMQ